jgi:preprotein translocase subunit SecE
MAEKSDLTPRRSFVQRIATYFRESRAELARVTWPTRDEIVQSTQVILIFAMVAMVLLGAYDFIFRFLTGLITR